MHPAPETAHPEHPEARIPRASSLDPGHLVAGVFLCALNQRWGVGLEGKSMVVEDLGVCD
jgi:hypothetical protein